MVTTAPMAHVMLLTISDQTAINGIHSATTNPGVLCTGVFFQVGDGKT